MKEECQRFGLGKDYAIIESETAGSRHFWNRSPGLGWTQSAPSRCKFQGIYRPRFISGTGGGRDKGQSRHQLVQPMAEHG